VLVAVTECDRRVIPVGDARVALRDRSIPATSIAASRLRAWVEQQNPASLGYVEQLYTSPRRSRPYRSSRRAALLSISYLGLNPREYDTGRNRDWLRSCMIFFP